MKLAILIDGGYYRAQWQECHGVANVPPAVDIIKTIAQIHSSVATRHNNCDVRLLRTYYYDTEPFGQMVTDPSGRIWNFRTTPQFKYQNTLLTKLKAADHMAVRRGRLKFRGWDSTSSPSKHRPVFVQKGVDMKIGLDVAWLATKRIVDIVVLVSGDTDFVAPMKLARTEGVEVWLYTLGSTAVSELIEHSDVYVKGTI